MLRSAPGDRRTGDVGFAVDDGAARDRGGENVGDKLAERAARAEVDRAKRHLGERGAVWWDDGAPDYNRFMARTTPYADWFSARS